MRNPSSLWNFFTPLKGTTPVTSYGCRLCVLWVLFVVQCCLTFFCFILRFVISYRLALFLRFDWPLFSGGPDSWRGGRVEPIKSGVLGRDQPAGRNLFPSGIFGTILNRGKYATQVLRYRVTFPLHLKHRCFEKVVSVWYSWPNEKKETTARRPKPTPNANDRKQNDKTTAGRPEPTRKSNKKNRNHRNR